MDARERAAQLWSSDWDDVNPDNPDFDNAWIDKVATAIRVAEREAAEKARREALEEGKRIAILATTEWLDGQADLMRSMPHEMEASRTARAEAIAWCSERIKAMSRVVLASSPGKESDR